MYAKWIANILYAAKMYAFSKYLGYDKNMIHKLHRFFPIYKLILCKSLVDIFKRYRCSYQRPTVFEEHANV